MEHIEVYNNNTNQEKPEIEDEIHEKSNDKRIFVLDTAFFIKLKPLDITSNKYYTTRFVVDEIRDKKAKEFYNINKDFITIRNPNKNTIQTIVKFAKLSNDLYNLSIPDLSVIALVYELTKESNQDVNFIVREQPKEWIIVNKQKENTKSANEEDEEGFVEVKKGKKEPRDEDDDWDFGGSDWITSDNLNSQLAQYSKYEELTTNENAFGVFVVSDDYTLQNVCLKIGLNILSVDGLKIKQVKNYLLKCYSCEKFNFDTSIQFCQECGYPTLMRIGYLVNDKGEGIIFNKQAEPRNRGTQYNLPKPSIGKKATVIVLAEDQLKKGKKIDLEKNIERILDDYDQYKDIYTDVKVKPTANSSKNYEWGYPKKNPNVPKKYYSKKSRK